MGISDQEVMRIQGTACSAASDRDRLEAGLSKRWYSDEGIETGPCASLAATGAYLRVGIL